MAEKKTAGRKSKYETNIKPHLQEINEKIRQGVTEYEIAKALGIATSTLNKYKQQYQELAEALNTNKGADVLQKLINAGVEASIGYYRENETTTITINQDGNPKKTRVVTKTWYPPNATLNRFYVMNFGKGEGYTNDPIESELKQAKYELDKAEFDSKNWDAFKDDGEGGKDDGKE